MFENWIQDPLVMSVHGFMSLLSLSTIWILVVLKVSAITAIRLLLFKAYGTHEWMKVTFLVVRSVLVSVGASFVILNYFVVYSCIQHNHVQNKYYVSYSKLEPFYLPSIYTISIFKSIYPSTLVWDLKLCKKCKIIILYKNNYHKLYAFSLKYTPRKKKQFIPQNPEINQKALLILHLK